MHVQIERREPRKHRQFRVNRAHIRAFLDAVRDYPDENEIPEPDNARAMRPHIFGEEVTP